MLCYMFAKHVESLLVLYFQKYLYLIDILIYMVYKSLLSLYDLKALTPFSYKTIHLV